ncbi:MAG TPA: L,D-transpeptidase [Chloroflexia bacterium]|nr:L,D-transpeptidase [Chloroflexia bacterium]
MSFTKHKKGWIVNKVTGINRLILLLAVMAVASLALGACGNIEVAADNGAILAVAAPTQNGSAAPAESPSIPPGSEPIKTPDYKPVIWFSASSLKAGDTLVVSGSGYPPDTKLVISLGSNGEAPTGSYAIPTTDKDGKFSAKVKLDVQDGGAIQPGQVVVAVSTEDKSLAAGARVTLQDVPLTPTQAPTATPGPTTAPTATPAPPKPTATPLPKPGTGRWIDVNLSTQKLVAYDGNKVFYTTLISSGVTRHPTVTGTFNVYLKYVSQRMVGGTGAEHYDLPNVPYVMYFYQDYAVHGAYWHNNFGHPMSHGCVNTPVNASKILYDWAPIGTPVKVHY